MPDKSLEANSSKYEIKYRGLIYLDNKLQYSFGYFDTWIEAANYLCRLHDFVKPFFQSYLQGEYELATARCAVYEDGHVQEDAPAVFEKL